jgi:hypothetical protein
MPTSVTAKHTRNREHKERDERGMVIDAMTTRHTITREEHTIARNHKVLGGRWMNSDPAPKTCLWNLKKILSPQTFWRGAYAHTLDISHTALMQHANASAGYAAHRQNTAQRILRISGVSSHQFQPNEGSHQLCCRQLGKIRQSTCRAPAISQL